MEALLKTLASSKDAVGAGQGLLTMLALLLGGAWAYFKFVQGRVFAARLEPAVEGRLVRRDDEHFVIAKVCIKNVGLSRVDLNKELSTIELFGYPVENYMPAFHAAFLEKFGVTQAILRHKWIEPNECIVEERILALPPERLLALELRLKVLADRRRWAPNVEWNAVTVVTPEPGNVRGPGGAGSDADGQTQPAAPARSRPARGRERMQTDLPVPDGAGSPERPREKARPRAARATRRRAAQ